MNMLLIEIDENENKPLPEKQRVEFFHALSEFCAGRGERPIIVKRPAMDFKRRAANDNEWNV